MSRATQAKNPWVGRTYLPDNVRMEEPPAWFLQQIHDYDAELVIIPSRARPFAYVIARRVRNKRWSRVQIDTATQPDTLMCMHYGLIPVCYMFKHGPQWSSDNVLRSLRARDLWRVGGGDKAADIYEQQETAEKAKTLADIRDDFWNRSGDAWRSYQYRTGQRVSTHLGPGAERSGAPSTAPLVVL